MTTITPEAKTGLQKGTNWWGAFVIGLAGTILVTGIAPYAVQGMGATAIWAIGINTIFGLVLCLCLAELACMWPHRTGGIPSYTAASFEPLVGTTVARHLGGLSGWSYWLGWFPVAPINMILMSAYLSSLFGIPQGGTIHLFGSFGAPISTTVLLISFAGLLVIYIPCYFGVKLGAGFATVLGVASMVPADPAGDPPAVQDRLLPLVERRRVPRAQGRRRQLHLHHRLDVPDHLERDRDGGGSLLRGGVPQRPARREDRDDRRGHLRDAHLHPHPAGLRRRARRRADHRGPAHPVHGLQLRDLRPRLLDQVVHRPAADPRPAAQRAERDHGHRPLALPGVGRRHAAPLVRQDQRARRAGQGDGVQRRRVDGRGAFRQPGPHLHFLQRRLPVLLRDVAGRLLRLPAAPSGDRAAAPPAWLRQVPRACDLRFLGGGLLLRRLERAEHRGRPELRPRPVHTRPGDHGDVLPAVPLAQAR